MHDLNFKFASRMKRQPLPLPHPTETLRQQARLNLSRGGGGSGGGGQHPALTHFFRTNEKSYQLASDWLPA